MSSAAAYLMFTQRFDSAEVHIQRIYLLEDKQKLSKAPV